VRTALVIIVAELVTGRTPFLSPSSIKALDDESEALMVAVRDKSDPFKEDC